MAEFGMHPDLVADLKAEVGHVMDDLEPSPDGVGMSRAVSGGRKQTKQRAYTSMPWDAIRALSKHYYLGFEKYPNDPDTNQPNYRKGYNASLSFEAMMDHAIEWQMGHDIDPENGSEHILAVAWHALNLWLLSNTEWDDRWKQD